MSAVYEHLLANERETVLHQIWSILKPGGIFFLDQTPNRLFPVVEHTTGGVWFINYFPDWLAFIIARKFSKREIKNDSWETLLRKGIRGGSEKEIMKILRKNTNNPPTILKPKDNRYNDNIDYHFAIVEQNMITKTKKIILKIIKCFTGITFLSDLSLAIKKNENT